MMKRPEKQVSNKVSGSRGCRAATNRDFCFSIAGCRKESYEERRKVRLLEALSECEDPEMRRRLLRQLEESE